MAYALPWQPCIDAAVTLIEQSREAGQPVFLDHAVREILVEYPEAGLSDADMARIIRDLVVRQRWSLSV